MALAGGNRQQASKDWRPKGFTSRHRPRGRPQIVNVPCGGFVCMACLTVPGWQCSLGLITGREPDHRREQEHHWCLEPVMKTSSKRNVPPPLLTVGTEWSLGSVHSWATPSWNSRARSLAAECLELGQPSPGAVRVWYARSTERVRLEGAVSTRATWKAEI